jgi:pimeloyl-ACP methyl ester carboxylesterase
MERPLNGTQSHASPTPASPVQRHANVLGTGAILAGAAAALAAMALWNTYRARKVEREHPPAGRFVTVDGVRLHYVEKGEGSPPVVLIHGNVVTAEDFDLSGVLDLAAERGHRVVAFDRPGFGYSDRPRRAAWTPAAQADLLRQTFARLGIERPIVLGHSWGALVALALALNHPDAVRGLVVLSGYYYPTLRIDVPLVSLAAIPLIGDVLRYTVSPLVGTAMLPLNFKLMFGPAPVPDRFKRGFPRGLPVRPSQLRAEAQESASMVPAVAAMQDRYRELRMPVVIMAGAKDRVVDVGRHAMRLHEDIPQSSLRLSPGVGHMLHYAVPEKVADAIEAAATGRPTTAVHHTAADLHSSAEWPASGTAP